MIALAAGVFAGRRKGFIVPLVVQAGALLSLATLYAGPLQGTVPSGLTGHDVFSVLLAIDRGCPLLTCDLGLARAATGAGLEVTTIDSSRLT